jgi:pimeloyl-ACP methyl ester carboxylesterase
VTDNGLTYIRSTDGNVSGRLVGPRDCGNLPLLVCIHGGGSNGRYFQLKGRSLSDMAADRGFPVLLIDRPGYCGNPALPGPFPIASSVPVIRRFVDEVQTGAGYESRNIVLIGHSIGGAIALQLAAERGDWPLLGIAVSGIGDVSPPSIQATPLRSNAINFVPPPAFADALFYDPERTLDWKALVSLRTATEPWLTTEIAEIIGDWPKRFPLIAGSIDVPVHLRLAEHDRIWETGTDAVSRMVATIKRAPRVDSGLLEGGGHLYEAYRNGRSLIAAQLDFLADCAANATIAAPIRSCSSAVRSG